MSANQEKLNEQLLNVVLSDKDSEEAKLKKVKYLVRLGADVNAMFFGKSMLFWAKETGVEEMVEFLKENGAKEFEIAKEEADRLAKDFWDKNGKIKSVEEIISLVKCGASLSAHKKNTNEQIWQDLSLGEMNEILKILPKGYEIDGNVNLNVCGLKELPDFSKVKVRGNFCCSKNKLISLKGAPKKVGGSFWCDSNSLINLIGAPSEVGRDFCCSKNKLISLKGAPKKVGACFYCSNNQLTNLIGAPKEVGEDFHCSNNQLTTLEGATQKVGGWFYCKNNQLTTLEGAPQKVKGDFDCSHNRLMSLEGKPQKIGGEFKIEKEVLDKIRGKETKSFGDIWGRLFGGR